MNKVRIEADYIKTSNYALFHNRIPVCQAIEVTNITEEPIGDIAVACSGEFISDFHCQPIASINPGETVRISPFSVNPDQKRLGSITERAVSNFKLTATSYGETIGEETLELEFMPYDHWTGTGILPQTIVSFITPNHPAINAVVVKSAAIMKRLTGSSALKAYQTGDTNDVRQQVAAVFAAVHDLGIIYRGIPASYETIGQRITMPDQILASKAANCLELTLLMASVLEAIGINCIIIIQTGHAYLGVWLVDDCYPCSVCDDPAFIEKNCSRGIEEMMVFECTQATQENVSFEQAIHIAETNLADHSQFELFIDVKRSRLERILPLPTRMEIGGVWTFDSEGTDHDSC
ncbi:MAG: DNA helicase, partial [Muribaculaceae bacterium]|nr:DNA helicase [Muribaculaceae bacterium]